MSTPRSATLTREAPASATESRREWARHCDRVAFGILLTALVWAPWPLGSNRPWALALLGMLVWSGLLIAAVGRWLMPAGISPRSLPRGWLLPVLALAGFAVLLAAQIWPGLGRAGSTISIDPHATRVYLFTTLLYGGGWLLVLATVTDSERMVRLLATLLLAGVLQALAAVLLSSAGARYVLWLTDFDQSGRAMGSFPNPDHLAGYMELTLAAGLGWLLSQFGSRDEQRRSPNWQGRAVAVLHFLLSGKMLLRLVLIVLVIALVMTHSRMGNGAFFMSLLLVGAVVAWRSERLRKPALWLVASMALVDIFIIGQWVGLDRVVERLKDTAEASSTTVAGFGLDTPPPPPREESLARRLEVPRLSLQLVAQRPWFGHGGGTYVTAFPPFKQEGLPWYWTHAHNDYVQVASDTGLVGLALWLSVGLVTVWRATTLLSDRSTRANRGSGVAALMAVSCMGLHSIVDFNLHIPANALTFTVLLAAVWAAPTAAARARSAAVNGSGTRPDKADAHQTGNGNDDQRNCS